MAKNETIFYETKSELLDRMTEDDAIESYEEWFEVLKGIIGKTFGVRKIDFIIRQEDDCRQLGESQSTTITSEMFCTFTSETNKNVEIEKFRKEYFPSTDLHYYIEDYQSGRSGLLVMKSTALWNKFIKTSIGQQLPSVIERTFLIIGRRIRMKEREAIALRLLSMNELFNSTMDSKVILEGIVTTVKDAFPGVEVEILLSHEQKSLSHTFKLLDYMNERTSTMNAFVSGELTSETEEQQSIKILNAPILGRQGIYGVIQLQAPSEYMFTSTEKDFMKIIASTAGTSLENAKLYDQSYHVIKELQLVNETSRKLNDNMKFSEMIIYLKQQLIKAFKPDEIAFVFYGEDETQTISSASSSFFRTVLSTYYVEYASNYFNNDKEALFDASFGDTLKEPVPFESFIALPISNQKQIIGFVALLHTENYYFSFDSFKLMGSLINHSSLAFSNSMLRDRLQEIVDKDYLTKLFTRNYLDRTIKQAMSTDNTGVFMLIDVDDFKTINDTYGHVIGDKVLQDISAGVLQEITEKGIAARWGGEEIAIYLPNANDSIGLALSQSLLQLVPKITDPSVTVSIGMKSWNAFNPTTYKELFHNADKALYSAKQNGKNQIVIFGATPTLS